MPPFRYRLKRYTGWLSLEVAKPGLEKMKKGVEELLANPSREGQ